MTPPEMITESFLSAYLRRGTCTFAHDPKDMPRPDGAVRPVGYLEVGPGEDLGAGLHRWHRLAPARRVKDEVMHRFYLRYMQRLAEDPSFEACKVFYPDDAGMMLACVLIPLKGRPPRMAWIGFNARQLYTAGVVALTGTPSAVLPEGMK